MALRGFRSSLSLEAGLIRRPTPRSPPSRARHRSDRKRTPPALALSLQGKGHFLSERHAVRAGTALGAQKPRSRGMNLGFCVSALGGIRTPNLLIRSQMLYPLSYERWASQSLACGHVEDEIDRPRARRADATRLSRRLWSISGTWCGICSTKRAPITRGPGQRRARRTPQERRIMVDRSNSRCMRM
jgi:hypothetical protein